MRVIDLSTLSLVGGSGIAEVKIPLWWADGTSASIAGTTDAYAQDGTSTLTTSSSGSAVKLFTLNSTWLLSIKAALEVTIWSNGASYSAVGVLWDFTTSTAFNSNQAFTTSTSATVVRSSQFTLTPNHVYGVSVNSNNSNGTAYISDASLIIFPT